MPSSAPEGGPDCRRGNLGPPRQAASDATLAGVRQHLSDREVVEAIFTVGNYMMVARLLETTGVDLDKPAGTSIVDSAKR